MNTLEVLTCARELLSDPAKWIKGAYAKTAAGSVVDATDPDACCFCALGAMRKCGGEDNEDDTPAAWALRDAANEKTSAHYYNDAAKTTHADILALFDRAIAKVKAEEQPV